MCRTCADELRLVQLTSTVSTDSWGRSHPHQAQILSAYRRLGLIALRPFSTVGGSTALPNALGASAEIRKSLRQDIGRVAGRVHLAHVKLARCPSGLQPQASELDVLRHPQPLAS